MNAQSTRKIFRGSFLAFCAIKVFFEPGLFQGSLRAIIKKTVRRSLNIFNLTKYSKTLMLKYFRFQLFFYSSFTIIFMSNNVDWHNIGYRCIIK